MSDLDRDFDKFDNEDDVRPIETGVTARDIKEREAEAERHKELAKHMVDGDKNNINPGDMVDLLKKEPSLRNIIVAGGWDQKDIEQDRLDIDLSCFLLDRNDKTRVDEDFVFYNSPEACEGAVKLGADSRTGAGDGDDESAFLDLTGIPFDIIKIMFVLSIYDDKGAGHNFGLARNMYIRLINKDDMNELARLPLDEATLNGHTGVLGFCLVREGPKWFLQALAQTVPGGLGAIASGYGIIVQEQVG